MGKFKDLEVWQLSKELAGRIIRLSEVGPLQNRFGLKDQLQRSALSVPSNIAEGEESGSVANSIRYFRIAKGSLAEVRTQLVILFESDLLDAIHFETLYSEADLIAAKLEKLIEARLKNKLK